MDLLQYLIVPTTFTSSHFLDQEVPNTHSSHLSTDALPVGAFKLPALSAKFDDPCQALYDSLPSSDDLEDGTTSVTTRPNDTKNGQKQIVCAFYFRYGECRRDPASATYDGSTKICPFLHNVDRSKQDLKVKFHPFEIRHRKRERKLRDTRDLSAREGGGNPSSLLSITPKNKQPEDGAEGQASDGAATNQKGKKRKRDSSASKSSQISKVVKQNASQAVHREPTTNGTKETCFFWYHGKCVRDSQCQLLHAITSPPSTVQPPPGYIHRTPCRLPLCPGDHVWVDHGPKTSHAKPFASTLARSQAFGAKVMENDAMMGALDYSEDAGSHQDDTNSVWYLGGFPDGPTGA